MDATPYRILSVDPGYGRIGIAILDQTEGRPKLLFSECLETNPQSSLPERLAELRVRLEEVLNEYRPEALALETLFFSKNRKTALAVAEGRGVIVSTVAAQKLPVFEYSPAQVKIAITGYGNSDKKQIKAMLDRLLMIKKKIKLDDEYDAIAVGLTHLASYRVR